MIINFHKEPRKNLKNLEKRLKKIGWKNLRWVSNDHVGGNPNVRLVLYGLPPNYNGVYSDYIEGVVHTLINPKNKLEDLDEIEVRDNLSGPTNYNKDIF